ncbi:MAG: TonB-dependent receptor [Balneolaceae bacterium]|nr:TonB-dependent receptor [Balneolaceae bacterium]
MTSQKILLAGLLALATLLCLPPKSVAQDGAQSGQASETDTLDVRSLGQLIVSADRFESDAASVGRNVTVIDRRQIRISLAHNVGELLDRQAGLHVTGDNQTPGSLQNVFLRHNDGNNTLVMIDGVRISDPSTNSNSVDLSELSLAGVERIEIVRGSHSTLYGSSAIGGVINIITGRGAEEHTRVTAESRTGALQEGMFSTSNSLDLQGDLGGGFYAGGGLTYDWSNGMDATIDTAASGFNPQDRDGFEKLDFYARTGYRGDRLDVHASYRRSDQTVEADQGAYADDGNAESTFRRNLVRYGVTGELSDRLSLSLEGAWSDVDRGFVNDSSLVDPMGAYDGTYTESHGDGTLWENDLTATWLADGLRLTAGLERSRETMNNRSYTFSSAFNFESRTNLDSLDLESAVNSAFLHADLDGSLLAEQAEAVSLVLGARVAGHDRFGTHITYEVNPRLRLGEHTLGYAALTTGFNAPSLYQLYSPAFTPGYHTDRGNPGLEPEESVSWELGLRRDLGESTRLELSFFRTAVSNDIQYVYLWKGKTPVSGLSFLDYRGDTYINISEQRMTGVEVSGRMQATPQLALSGSFSYIHSELMLDSSDIDRSYTGDLHVQIYESGVFLEGEEHVEGLTRRPRFTANLSADWRPSSDWSLGISASYTDKRQDVYYSGDLGPFGAQDRTAVDGYLLADLRAGYEVSHRLWLGARVENLLDSSYEEILGYNTRGRGFFLKATLTL